jgi:hypothetical protein
MYLFYLISRVVDFEDGVKLLPEMHQRIGLWDDSQGDFAGFGAYTPPLVQNAF